MSLVDGIYKADIVSLRQAVTLSATKIFADRQCQQRMVNRVMREINLQLTPVPPAPQESDDIIEIPILDETYKHTIVTMLKSLEDVRGHHLLKVEGRLFAAAWEKARLTLDCRDLHWSGWDAVLNRLISFMDTCGDGNPVFVMMRALEQWRETLREAGIAEMEPSTAPYLHFHVEMLAGHESVVDHTLFNVGHRSSLVLLNSLGLNNERSRYLLTMLSPVESRRVHNLLKIDGVNKVTGGKLDYTL